LIFSESAGERSLEYRIHRGQRGLLFALSYEMLGEG
jgi:hypothetical protein